MKNGSMDENQQMNIVQEKSRAILLIKTMSPYQNFQHKSSSNPFE
jgi:hypothetical protein